MIWVCLNFRLCKCLHSWDEKLIQKMLFLSYWEEDLGHTSFLLPNDLLHLRWVIRSPCLEIILQLILRLKLFLGRNSVSSLLIDDRIDFEEKISWSKHSDSCYLNPSILEFNVVMMWCVLGFQVPVGGCYRLIDIPMSNCINSSLNKIFVLTQFNSASLNRHISRTYFGNGVNFGDGFVEVCNYACITIT